MSRNKKIIVLKVIGLTVLACGIIYLYFKKKENESRRAKSPRYSIATTTGWAKNYRSTYPIIHYEFLAGGVLMHSSMEVKNIRDVNVPGGLYIVEYEAANFKNNILLLDKIVKFKATVPLDGWDSIPTFVLQQFD
jgi:hypothetical protein